MTVHELRKKGYKVRVIHVREDVYKLLKEEVEESYSYRYFLTYLGKSATGGKTVVEISTPDDQNVFGISYCHPKENYNKKEGVKYALEKALQKISHV
jgi:hypothetical protein